MQSITEQLFALQDLEYNQFHSKLMPTINPDVIIGVRTPKLRKFTKEIKHSTEVEEFLRELPHHYYEENNLHGFLIEKIQDFDKAVNALETFLPYIDNWATCDMLSPKIFAKNKEKLLPYIQKWLTSSHTYTVRYGIVSLMRHYLDADFRSEYLEMVAHISSDDYYIRMAMAWFFAEALLKQYETALPYLIEKRLPLWVHNKTICKYTESLRPTKEEKDAIKALRISANI